MLVGTCGGSSYSEPEYAAWLDEAGFREIRHARLPGITGYANVTRMYLIMKAYGIHADQVNGPDPLSSLPV
jgi:hypothetical protein